MSEIDRYNETLNDTRENLKKFIDILNTEFLEGRNKYKKALQDVDKIVTEYSKREDYLLGGLYTDLIDDINKVLRKVL
jgi:hypothetical protein